MNFIHYSPDNKIITKENFIKPDFEILPKGDDRYGLNPPHVLFLSLQNADGNSDWYDRCVEKIGEGKCWIDGTKNVFNIDVSENNKNIYVINNPTKLVNFYSKYSVFKQNSNFRAYNILVRNIQSYKRIIDDIIFILNYL